MRCPEKTLLPTGRFMEKPIPWRHYSGPAGWSQRLPGHRVSWRCGLWP